MLPALAKQTRSSEEDVIDQQRSKGPPMAARIFRPAKTAMQSGEARTKDWVLEFEPAAPETRDPLMGWTSSTDTLAQVRLEFDSKDEAIAYATRNGLAYTVSEPKPRRAIRKAYADNFKFGRIGSWTH
jgi:ETC complex I subunit conserved region